jgi:hypothetical protein
MAFVGNTGFAGDSAGLVPDATQVEGMERCWDIAGNWNVETKVAVVAAVTLAGADRCFFVPLPAA